MNISDLKLAPDVTAEQQALLNEQFGGRLYAVATHPHGQDAKHYVIIGDERLHAEFTMGKGEWLMLEADPARFQSGIVQPIIKMLEA
jgi:hypothetical protein